MTTRGCFDVYRSEYLMFQKITKLEYEFPSGFCDKARDLVEKLLVSNLIAFVYLFHGRIWKDFCLTSNVAFFDVGMYFFSHIVSSSVIHLWRVMVRSKAIIHSIIIPIICTIWQGSFVILSCESIEVIFSKLKWNAFQKGLRARNITFEKSL